MSTTSNQINKPVAITTPGSVNKPTLPESCPTLCRRLMDLQDMIALACGDFARMTSSIWPINQPDVFPPSSRCLGGTLRLRCVDARTVQVHQRTPEPRGMLRVNHGPKVLDRLSASTRYQNTADCC
jgi:hypothetical protein